MLNNDVDDVQDTGLCVLQPQIFSRIRNFNNFAMNSIGYLFSTSPSSLGSPTDLESTSCDNDNWDYKSDLETSNALDGNNQLGSTQGYNDVLDIRTVTAEASTPTPTRSNSPFRSNRFQDVKRIFTNFALSRQTNSHDQMHSGYPVSNDYQPSPLPSETLSSMPSASCSSSSDHFVTPPLTPDIVDDPLVLSPDPSNCSHQDDMHYDPYRPTRNAAEFDRDEDISYSPSHSLEIKEGKKPDRVNCYDALIEDVPCSATSPTLQRSPSTDDRDEWYGLEYTLELSSRERRPSNTESLSPGEHSKSRKSWAAIHQGTIHPYFEDEDYYQWKNWHRYLDRRDERKKHKRAFEFKVKSKDLAWLYADELRTRDVMYWQKEGYGAITRDVTERLAILAQYRPDPYVPAMKHNLAWYLKRSRSVACLRELRSLPRDRDYLDERATLESDND